MPNHVENHIEFNGDKQQIDAMLNKIKSDEYGTGTIDFKKIISMPETLNIEAGSRTDCGLKAYREYIEVYTSGRSDKEALKALENIPTESENAFLCQRTDIIRSVQVCALNMIEPPCTERYARWCERSATQLMGSLLLD